MIKLSQDRAHLSETLQAIGVFLSLGVIIGLVVKRFNYGLALGSGAVVMGLFFGLSLEEFIDVGKSTLLDQVTIELALVVVLIPILAAFMKETGLISQLIETLAGILSAKAVLAVIPAIFGLLPMLGGALLSAPLIDKEANELGQNAEKKSLINMWFRHSWNGVTPLSSMLILTARLANVKLYDLVLANLPFALVQTVIGYFSLIRPIKQGKEKAAASHFQSALPRILRSLAPILTAITLNILGIPLVVALAVGIGLTMILGKVSFDKASHLLRKGISVKLIFTIVGVMFFRHMLQDSGAIDFLILTLKGAGISQWFVLTLLPIVLAAITANPSAAVSIAVPLAMPLFKISPPLISILYQSSFFAYNLSPLHLCLIVTLEYYRAGLRNVYKWLVPLWGAVYLSGLGICYILLQFS
ncbi:MAG: DUF401 family protein [archaeon]